MGVAFKKNPESYEGRCYSEKLWTVKVMSSQLSNKLDVEAYSREYTSAIKEIFKLKEKGLTLYTLGDLCTSIFAGWVGF